MNKRRQNYIFGMFANVEFAGKEEAISDIINSIRDDDNFDDIQKIVIGILSRYDIDKKEALAISLKIARFE